MRTWENQSTKLQKIGILLFDDFSNHCLANTVEPLRAANQLSGRKLYDWVFLTLDGAAVTSSSGLQVGAHASLREQNGDLLIVMPSYGYLEQAGVETIRGLRAAAGRFDRIAGFDTGSWLLAEAGLLASKRATIHWEVLVRFAERFDDIDVRRERHVIDGDRITCSGAMAAFDLIMELIAGRHGEALRLEVATLFMSGDETHILPTRDPVVARAVAGMREYLENPVPIGQIARMAGRSQKELERRTRAALGTTPQ
ncbi:MAG: GlxA family transcriptional regulator, partial [Halocynthiibacter sp.]